MCHMRGSRTEMNNNKNIIIIFFVYKRPPFMKREKNHSHKTNSKCLKNNTVKGK